eukprot:670382-Prymnesium_polylepis.1
MRRTASARASKLADDSCLPHGSSGAAQPACPSSRFSIWRPVSLGCCGTTCGRGRVASACSRVGWAAAACAPRTARAQANCSEGGRGGRALAHAPCARGSTFRGAPAARSQRRASARAPPSSTSACGSIPRPRRSHAEG